MKSKWRNIYFIYFILSQHYISWAIGSLHKKNLFHNNGNLYELCQELLSKNIELQFLLQWLVSNQYGVSTQTSTQKSTAKTRKQNNKSLNGPWMASSPWKKIYLQLLLDEYWTQKCSLTRWTLGYLKMKLVIRRKTLTCHTHNFIHHKMVENNYTHVNTV